MGKIDVTQDEFERWLKEEYVPICGGADPPEGAAVAVAEPGSQPGNEPQGTPSEPGTKEPATTPPQEPVGEEGVEVPGKKGRWIPYDRFKQKVDLYNDVYTRNLELEEQMQESETRKAEIDSWVETMRGAQADPAVMAEVLLSQKKGDIPFIATVLRKLGVNPEDLVGVEPDTGKTPAQSAENPQLKELMTWKEQKEMEEQYKTFNNEFESRVDKMFKSHAIPEDKQDLYRDLLDARMAQFANWPLSKADVLFKLHLPKLFADIHNRVSGLSRAEIAGYTQGKKKTVVPGGAAGSGAPPAVKEDFSTPEKRMAALKSEMDAQEAGATH